MCDAAPQATRDAGFAPDRRVCRNFFRAGPMNALVGDPRHAADVAADLGRAANTSARGGNQETSSVKALQTGVRERFLVHGEALQRLARVLDRGDADDLVQDTWLRVLARPGDGDGPGPQDTPKWLRGVLRNIWRMDRRATRRRIERETWASLPTPCVERPDVELADDECRAQIGALLDALPEHLRSVVRLRYFDGLSAAAIARRENIPAGTVRRRLKDALDRLRADKPEHLRGGAVVLALHEGAATASAKLLGGGLVAMKLSTKAIVAAVIVSIGIASTVAWHEETRHDAASPTAREELASATTEPRRNENDSPRTEDGPGPVAGSASPLSRAEPQPRRPQRARRDALLSDIRAAREAYRKSLSSSEPAAEFRDDQVDREYIRERVREDLIPSATSCYNNVLVRDPEFGGRIVLQFAIVADENLGGVVEQVGFGEDTDVADEELLGCLHDAMYEMTFDPPKSGGTVQVSYPMTFEPG
jgi:RNA polymerase sigma-70 factor (ECF subfamily)